MVLMRYSYYDLGFVKSETIVTINLSASANVHLMDSENYTRYSRGDKFRAYGGYISRSPVSFTIPSSGYWFVTIDLGGYDGIVSHSCLIEEPVGKGDYESIGWQIQDDNDDAIVKVTSRYLEKNPQYGSPEIERTDLLVFDKETGKHIHLTVDDQAHILNLHKPK